MAQELHSGAGGDDRGSQGQCTTCIVGYVTQVTSSSDKTVTIKKSDKTVSHINHTLLPLVESPNTVRAERGCSHRVTQSGVDAPSTLQPTWGEGAEGDGVGELAVLGRGKGDGH